MRPVLAILGLRGSKEGHVLLTCFSEAFMVIWYLHGRLGLKTELLNHLELLKLPSPFSILPYAQIRVPKGGCQNPVPLSPASKLLRPKGEILQGEQHLSILAPWNSSELISCQIGMLRTGQWENGTPQRWDMVVEKFGDLPWEDRPKHGAKERNTDREGRGFWRKSICLWPSLSWWLSCLPINPRTVNSLLGMWQQSYCPHWAAWELRWELCLLKCLLETPVPWAGRTWGKPVIGTWVCLGIRSSLPVWNWTSQGPSTITPSITWLITIFKGNLFLVWLCLGLSCPLQIQQGQCSGPGYGWTRAGLGALRPGLSSWVTLGRSLWRRASVFFSAECGTGRLWVGKQSPHSTQGWRQPSV